ncbi:hypothetical protein F0L74_32060 [Chitinophaga agrisoli]|uniref:Uncharacterized protein n=1 Tax=Chitinophaga agrisoli TaxID=2607653 RepID=A0A5B2VMB9_9BACT|nr:hypothetical protein [Chitinophaga agrisoli]KAA2240773.1 hypothetical protein F0L74_32060 [Chitinophaga agrisoli]
MLQVPIRQTLARALMFTALCLTLFAFKAPTGIDSFEIYLNNKLVLKEYARKDISLRSLQLDKAATADQLVIYYTHCHGKGPGTSRTITVKDDKGNALKQWKFADATASKGGMTIPVAELLALENKNAGAQLTIYYAAAELPDGQMLASL